MLSMDLVLSPLSVTSAAANGVKRVARKTHLVKQHSRDHIKSKPDETSVFYHTSEVRSEILEGYDNCCRAARDVRGTALELQSLYNETLNPTDTGLTQREKADECDRLTEKRDEGLKILYQQDTSSWFGYQKLSDSSVMKTVKTPQERNALVLAHVETFLSYDYASRGTIRRNTEKRFKNTQKRKEEITASSSKSAKGSSCATEGGGILNEKGVWVGDEKQAADSICRDEEASVKELI